MGNEAQREALARLIREGREDYSRLSRLLGRNSAYIQQFIKRGTPKRLSEEDRKTLAQHFGVSESELGGPVESRPEPAKDVVFVPRYDVEASAGAGTLDPADQATSHYGFDAELLRQVCRGGFEKLTIIRVRGDSMMPTLSDGDDIMVDHSEGALRIYDGVHVLRRDDTLVVKRVAINPATRRAAVTSDNPAYAAWPDCDPKDLDIVGRVVWVGKRMV